MVEQINEVITHTENEDLVFSLADRSLLKISARIKSLFPEFDWNQILNLEDFEKLAPLPAEFGKRDSCYPRLKDVKVSHELKSRGMRILVDEIGWYNPQTFSIHLLIFPGFSVSSFSSTFLDVQKMMDRLQQPSVLFDYSLDRVLAANQDLISVLCVPLSVLGQGFQIQDFFVDQMVFQRLMDWRDSDSITLHQELMLRLVSPEGRWFEVAFSKVTTEQDIHILAILKDIHDLKQVHDRQVKKNLILSRLSEVQNSFLSKTSEFMPYQLFLDTILEVSNAQYGFVGEVGTSADGNKLMKIHAVTDFSQHSPAAKKLINKLKDDNFFFRHFDNLFGAAIKTGQVICENNPPTNPHSSNKVIPGHPTISNFLGIPILSGEQVVGLIGLGNKQGGFNGADVEDLKPFATTYSVILNALDNEERNQTLQKDATDKALILSTVGDHSPDTIAVLDSEYEFKFLSPSYKKHFGRSVTEIEAKRKVRALIVKTLGQKYWQAEEHYRSRLRITTKELEHRWLDTSINIFGKGKEKKIIAFIREVSVQVKSEQSLRASLRKEREFKGFLSDFMNIVAHEFKTPLSTILSSLELSEYYLQSEGEEKLEKVNHHLGKIKSEAENLHKIVISSLAYDRFVKETINLKTEGLRLNQFVRDSLVQYGLTDLVLFKSELPETFKVEWDRFLMQTTLVNLVNNAIKFSPSRQKPIVSLVKTENGLELSVQDFGIGISQKDLPYIFTPFYRAANANDIEGTGMGLIAVKNFVKLHGGRISVNSEVNKGTLVKVEFEL